MHDCNTQRTENGGGGGGGGEGGGGGGSETKQKQKRANKQTNKQTTKNSVSIHIVHNNHEAAKHETVPQTFITPTQRGPRVERRQTLISFHFGHSTEESVKVTEPACACTKPRDQ